MFQTLSSTIVESERLLCSCIRLGIATFKVKSLDSIHSLASDQADQP